MEFWNDSLWIFADPNARNLETYSFAGGIWTLVDANPWFAFSNCECEVFDDTFYFYSQEMMKLKAYHPQNGSLWNLTDLDEHHVEYATGFIDGALYMFGGLYEVGRVVMDTTKCYDLFDERWYQWTPLPTPRYSCTGVVVNDLVYVIGGIDSSGNTSGRVEVYCPYNDTWIVFPSMNQPRINFRAAYLNGSIYAVGGESASRDEHYSSMERYSVPLVDLLIEDVHLDVPRNRPVLAGSVVTVEVPVTNVGDWPARDVEVRMEVDGVTQGTHIIPFLDAGGSTRIDFEWTALEGDGELRLSVDPGNAISERSEADNEVVMEVEVVPPKADLWVNGSSLVIEPTVFSDGDVVQVGIDVSNMGWVPATDVTWSFQVDGEEVVMGELQNDLDPQEGHHQVIEWTVTRGNRTINVSFTHPGEEIGTYPDHFSTSVWVPGRGDLAFASAPAVEPSSVPVNGPFNLTFEVVNRGESPVTHAVVHIAMEGTLTEAVVIGPLLPYANVTITRTFNATNPGRRSLSLILDPDGLVQESDEANNVVEISYDIVDHNEPPIVPPDGMSGWSLLIIIVISIVALVVVFFTLRRSRAR